MNLKINTYLNFYVSHLSQIETKIYSYESKIIHTSIPVRIVARNWMISADIFNLAHHAKVYVLTLIGNQDSRHLITPIQLVINNRMPKNSLLSSKVCHAYDSKRPSNKKVLVVKN